MSASNDGVQSRRARSIGVPVAVAVAIAALTALAALAAAPTVLAHPRPTSGDDARSAAAGSRHANEASVTIEIPEVRCAGCILRARKAVESVGGVLSLAEGDGKNRLVVTYEPGPRRPEAYVEALRKAGFAKAREVGGAER